MALLVGIVTPSAWPEAAPRPAGGDTTFTFGWVKDEPTLKVQGRGITFFKRVGRDRVSIRVEAAGDVVELDAELSGAIRVGRKGRYLQLQMKDNFEASVVKVQKLMVGSRALDGFEGMVASLASSETPQARSLRSSHALLNVVRGVMVTPAARPPVSASPGASRATFLAREEVPFACWA